MNPANDATELQGMINLAANFSEIMGIAVGFWLLIMSSLASASGLKGYWWKFLAAGFILILLGLADPGIANFLQDLNSPFRLYIALIAGVTILLIQIALAVLGFLSPSLIAVSEKLNRKGLIAGINLGALLFPPCWIVALVLAGMEMKKAREVGPLEQP